MAAGLPARPRASFDPDEVTPADAPTLGAPPPGATPFGAPPPGAPAAQRLTAAHERAWPGAWPSGGDGARAPARAPARVRARVAAVARVAARARLRSPATTALEQALASPLAVALALALVVACAYLLVAPPAADLQAATYRADLFTRAGFTLWDNGWYGGQNVLGYSVLSGALGALLGVRPLLALSSVVASGAFALIATRVLPRRLARVAAVGFALSMTGDVLAGRVPYAMGIAFALCAILALARARRALALALALLASVASPVAGAFLALAALAHALARAEWPPVGGLRTRATVARFGAAADELRTRAFGPPPQQPHARPRSVARAADGFLVCATALGTIALIAAAFPDGGYEPFAFSDVWPQATAALAIAIGVPRPWRSVRVGGLLYVIALVAAFAIPTPMGSNAERLGALLAGPLVAAALWERRRLLLALLAPALLYWQLAGPVGDLSKLVGDPSLSRAYFAPLARELRGLGGSAPLRIEVPSLGSHAEAAFLPAPAARAGAPDVVLARGWDRQLDTRFAPLFYRHPLAAGAYRSWLDENGVSFVALPGARLDFAAREEGALIRSGLPFLREVWRSAHWRLFAVRGAPPLASAPARLTHIGPDSLSLTSPRAGTYLVRARYTPDWTFARGHGCVRPGADGFIDVALKRPGAVRLAIRFSPLRLLSSGSRCG